MKRLSSSERWLLGTTPLLLLLPLGIQRWQQIRALNQPITVWEHTGIANSVAFSPDSLHLVTAGGKLDKGAEVRVWNLASKAREAEFKGQGMPVMILEARFSPNGNRVLGIKGDGIAEQWLWPNGEIVCALGIQGRVGGPTWIQAHTLGGRPSVTKPYIADSLGRLMSADYSPDGNTIITCGYMSSAKVLWDASTGAPIKRFASDLESFAGVRFAPDGKHFLSVRAMTYKSDPRFSSYDPYNIANQSGVVHFWDAQTTARVGKLPLVNTLYAAWSPDGKRVAVTHKIGTQKRLISNTSGQSSDVDLPVCDVEIWSVAWTKTGVQTHKDASMDNKNGDLIGGLDWSPDGKMIVGQRVFEGATVWKTSGEEVAKLSFSAQTSTGSVSPMTRTIAWSPNGKWIASVNGPHIELWDAKHLIESE